MTKSTWSAPQKAVTVFPISGEIIQYQLCLDEETSTETQEDGQTFDVWLYNYYEFCESVEFLKPEEVIKFPKKYINYVPRTVDPDPVKPTNELRKELDAMHTLLGSMITTLSKVALTEATFTATRNYTVNDLVIVNDTLYKVTANIQNGGTITPNSNVTQTTLSALIKALS